MIDVEQIKLDALKSELNKANKEIVRLEEEIKNDPLTIICDVNIEFSKLLKANQGEARMTELFNLKVVELAAKEKQAKKRAETYNLVALMDEQNIFRIKASTLQTEVANMEFRMRRSK